jgi:hypothetical protein
MSRRDRSILVSIVTAVLVVTGGAVIVGTSCLGRERGSVVVGPPHPSPGAPASDRTSAGGPPSEPTSMTDLTGAEVATSTERAHDAEVSAGVSQGAPVPVPAPAPAPPMATSTTSPPAIIPPGNAAHAPTALVPRTPLVAPLDAADGGHLSPPPVATTGTVDASVATPTSDAAVTVPVSPAAPTRRWLTEPPSWGASHMEQNPEAGAGPFQTEWPRWPR